MIKHKSEQLLNNVALSYGTNARWLRVRTSDYFGTLDFSGKHILDIGAGEGLYSCCVSALGAKRLVALEPELKGSSNDAIGTFRNRLNDLNLKNMEFYPITMQEFTSPPESFDIICMLASVNHLDKPTFVPCIMMKRAGQYIDNCCTRYLSGSSREVLWSSQIHPECTRSLL